MRTPLVRVLVLLSLLGLVVAVSPTRARAQAGGAARLVVKVADNWGVVPGATVTLARTDGSIAAVTVTDGTGVAVFAEIAPAAYVVTAAMPGFVDVSAPVEIARSEPRDLELRLVQVQFSSSVTVSTASRREELLLDVANPVTLIDQAQIADTHARTSKDLLIDQAGSGVLVHPGGGQGHVSINGIPNSGVLVLVDGQRLLGRDAIGNVNLEDLALTGVDRVEIVKGAGSALYGSDAIGGVINLITRRSAPGFTNLFQASGGSYDDYTVNDTLGYRPGRAGVSVAGGYRSYEGYDLSETDPQTIGQPESRWRTFGVNGDATLLDWLLLRGTGSLRRRDIDDYYFRGATQLGGVYNSRRELTRVALAPQLDVLVSPDTALTLAYTYGNYDRDETQIYPTREVLQVPWQEWNHEIELGGRQTWRAWGQSHDLQGGFERREERLDRASLRAPGTDARRQSRDVDVFWMQQELQAGPGLSVAAGFRYDRYSDFGDAWSPKLTATYALSSRQRARLTWGRGFRAPYFGELYLYTPPFFVGNPDLQPERADTYTAGYAWSGDRVQASLDWFRAHVEDGIVFDLSRQPFTYGNLREYRSQGVNGTLSASLPYGFVPSVSYAHVSKEDADGQAITDVPKHALYAKLLWTHARLGWRASLRGQVLDSVRFTDGTSQPEYQVWTAQVSKRFQAGAHAVGVFAQADNLFDEREIFRRDAEGQPIPGDFQVWIAPRTFLAGLTLDLALQPGTR